MSASGRVLVWQGRSANGTATNNSRSKTPPPRQRELQTGTETQTDNTLVVKIGLLGDAQTGKSTLLNRYTTSETADDEYVETLGVSCAEKTFKLPNLHLELSLWDLGGHYQYMSMLPLVCKASAAIIFTFDLTKSSTLTSVKQWYIQARQHNKGALPVLVGTKYDKFIDLPDKTRRLTSLRALSYAETMNAPIVFTSAPSNINVHKLFKIILARLFDLKCNISKTVDCGLPILDF